MRDDAYAIASAPYGIPKRTNWSREDMNLSWSGVGPAFGYVNSVRTTVCVSGADIAFTEMVDCESKSGVPRERVRRRLKSEPDPDGVV